MPVVSIDSGDGFMYASPDSRYVMDSSFELLEQTPDVYMAADVSNINLDHYFDNYDAHYSSDGACPAIKNLCNIMAQWIDEQPLAVQGMVLNANIYNSGMLLREFSGSVCNMLVDNYLLTNGYNDDTFEGLNLAYRIVDGELVESPNMYTTTLGVRTNSPDTIQIHNEEDILFPANIASAIIQNPRLYNFLLNFKSRLKKTFEIEVDFESMQKEYFKILQNTNQESLPMTYQTKPVTKKGYIDKQDKAKKAIKKGIKKFSNLFGPKDISSFVSGDGFVVSGNKFNWCFKPKAHTSIITMTHSPLSGHIPYKLIIQTKDNVVLGDCCVYVTENTPVIDQIITIMLYIQHDEDELLNNVNIFNRRPDYEKNQHLLPERLQTKTSPLFLTDIERQEALSVNLSSYSQESHRLNETYKEQIFDMIPSIIGIEKNFFNFMLNAQENPIVTGNKNALFKSNISKNQLLLS